MDEYKFQHEEDPALKKAATDAVNRTLWFQHWKRYKTNFKGQLFLIGVFLMMFGLLAIIPLPADHVTIIMAPKAWLYAIMPIALLWFAAIVTAASRGEKLWSSERQEVLKRPRSVMLVYVISYFSLLILRLVTDSKQPSVWTYLPPMIFIIGWDWYHLRKLKKNLITWGVLEADGSPRLLDSPPIVAELEKSEETIDKALVSSSDRPNANQSPKQKITI